MKNKLALLVPILMATLGAYALLTALGRSGEQVALISKHALPRGLALMLGAIGLAGGALVMATMLNGKNQQRKSMKKENAGKAGATFPKRKAQVKRGGGLCDQNHS